MTARLAPVVLRGERVTLEPLQDEHVEGLVAAAEADRSTFTHTGVPNGPIEMEAYVSGLLADADRGLVLPFVQRRTVESGEPSEIVGCTRYLDVKWWPTGERATELEIGGTWLATHAQRTGINTEAKLLLLTHAFEVLDVWRVAICTDAHNEQSRTAIERIGATFEGVLRNHRLGTGSAWPVDGPIYRNTAVYSIIREEWRAVRAHIEALLDR